MTDQARYPSAHDMDALSDIDQNDPNEHPADPEPEVPPDVPPIKDADVESGQVQDE